ncbi:MAG TPA: CaiB/BaiF CoA-transferase family protein, partial [Candidatus Binataceae bacterium]|nr:CaiB/BaiF CoA-transferase family protein [Candidatus Binataceae bacterium]
MDQGKRPPRLPLEGVRVAEFCHTIMGPSCTMILADLGAEIIKVEPIGGERTRRLAGFGSGYFSFFNRNKRSLALDLKSPNGIEVAKQVLRSCHGLVENFGPGTMARLGLDYASVKDVNRELVYCSLKGFLPGPYEQRVALDETVQMMSGLAYMTGPSGSPLRAGSSVVDIMGGFFGALAIIVALREVEKSGGQFIQVGLFETAAFLMGQHLAYAALSDGPIPPMPERVSAWAIYELFQTRDGESIFIGVVSDGQWLKFCETFGLKELRDDSELASNNQRIAARSWLIPRIKEALRNLTLAEALSLSEAAGVAFAPVLRPEALFDDKHLVATDSLLRTVLPTGAVSALPRLPILMGGDGFGLRCDPPGVGSDTYGVLIAAGLQPPQIEALAQQGIV